MRLVNPTEVVVVPAPPVMPPIPVAVAALQAADLKAEKAEKIAGLKATVRELWASGKADRVKTGHTLSLLQDELANPGHGTFLQAVRELGIPLSSAYAYMAEFKGKKPRPSKRRNDELVRVCPKSVKSTLGPLSKDPDALVAAIQRLLQETADSLLSCAGSSLTVTVSVQK